MIRAARPGDEPAIEAFLAAHPETSMFLRANLATHGLGTGVHPHATTYHLAAGFGAASGPVGAVFGLTTNGFLMCQAPGTEAPFAGYARAIAGQTVAGITGEAAQVDRLIAALGLAPDAFRLNHAEPLMRLELSDLAPPFGAIRPPVVSDLSFLVDWFLSYMRDTGLAAAGDDAAREEARDRAERAIAGGDTRLLLDGDRPQAMAALNARVAGMVQVGGVFVPADLRNRGLGRRMTAALLAEARVAGARSAILFANNDAAARAYAAIGFRQIGWYRVAVLHRPTVIGGASWA